MHYNLQNNEIPSLIELSYPFLFLFLYAEFDALVCGCGLFFHMERKKGTMLYCSLNELIKLILNAFSLRVYTPVAIVWCRILFDCFIPNHLKIEIGFKIELKMDWKLLNTCAKIAVFIFFRSFFSFSLLCNLFEWNSIR